jgi:hypothetical protein
MVLSNDFVIADQVSLMAVRAGLDMVMRSEFFPVFHLGDSQRTGPGAYRTGITQCIQHRPPDKVRTVFQASQGLGEVLIHLEGDYLFFFVSRVRQGKPPCCSIFGRIVEKGRYVNVLLLSVLIAGFPL